MPGIVFAIISCTFLVGDYFIQISVKQPSLLKGETDGISLLTQYNPHGIFIVLEEVSYLFCLRTGSSERINFDLRPTFMVFQLFLCRTGLMLNLQA
jgi:hypothetical protein